MSIPRLRQRATYWAPRALVVISCVLALLAMQSVNSAPVARNRPVVLKAAGTSTSGTAWEVTRRTPAVAARPATGVGRQPESVLSGTQRLHILATVDILQRLLMAELQPVQQDFLATLWLLPECPVVTIVPPAASGIVPRHTLPVQSLPEAEKAFAMARCQLAPPTI